MESEASEVEEGAEYLNAFPEDMDPLTQNSKGAKRSRKALSPVAGEKDGRKRRKQKDGKDPDLEESSPPRRSKKRVSRKDEEDEEGQTSTSLPGEHGTPCLLLDLN